MKKIISAEKQWRDEMNALINDYYDCDACCDGLGAAGDNEFYQLYNANRLYFFERCGCEYKKIDATDASEEYLLSTNWTKLESDDDWYNHKQVLQFLLDNACGRNSQSPIALCDLVWMGIYTDGDCISVTTYDDKEVEVSTEEIEAIRKEIVERCKGHSIEEVRDMFQGRTSDALGEPNFDFDYKGLEFYIYNYGNDEWWLGSEVYRSGVGLDCTEDQHATCKVLKLPVPPKEIKVDMEATTIEKPDLSRYEFLTSISFGSIVEKMRESCIGLISDLYAIVGVKFVEIDTKKWLKEEHCYFAEYNECYRVALVRNDKGNVVLTGTDDGEWDEYMNNNNWSFVSLEEMLYIINQLTSK